MPREQLDRPPSLSGGAWSQLAERSGALVAQYFLQCKHH